MRPPSKTAVAALLALGAGIVAAARPAEQLPAPQLVRRARYLMGTMFEISAWGRDREATLRAVNRAFAVIREADEMLSSYRPESALNRLNAAAANEAVPTPPTLFEALEASLKYSRLSGGAFDVTVAPLIDVWRRAAETDRLPSEMALGRARALVGADKIKLGPRNQVRRAASGVKIDFGAIGKGWALDRAAEALRKHGVSDALINAGESTLYALGDDGERRGWLTGVRNPRGGGPAGVEFRLRDAAVSTSASYERFFEIQGRRYSHIIDPRSGLPVEAVLSVTVTAPTATEADALSTAVYVLGPDAGAKLLDRLGRRGWIVDGDGSDSHSASKLR